MLGFFGINQAKIGFMHERGGLQGLTRPLLCQFLRSKLAQLVVNQRQQLFCGRGGALLDRGQNACNVRHSGQSTARRTRCLAWVQSASVPSTEACLRIDEGHYKAKATNRENAFSGSIPQHFAHVMNSVTSTRRLADSQL